MSFLCAHESRQYIESYAGEIIAWSCNKCLATGMYDLPAFPTSKECEWCGDDLVPDRTSRNAPMRWIYRRYCSKTCYEEDLEDRRVTGRRLSNPDPAGRGKQLEYEEG